MTQTLFLIKQFFVPTNMIVGEEARRSDSWCCAETVGLLREGEHCRGGG